MGQNRVYEIAFVGLTMGTHAFNYRIEDKFFLDFGPQDFTNCDANIQLSLDKKQGFMQLHFDIGGSIDALCDRCGNPLKVQLWDEFDIVVKLVDNPEEMNSQEEDADIYYVDRNESHFSIANWIYEFINLSIPFQKICVEDDKGKSTCNQQVIDQLNHFRSNPSNIPNDNIWKGLDQFKDLETPEKEL